MKKNIIKAVIALLFITTMGIINFHFQSGFDKFPKINFINAKAYMTPPLSDAVWDVSANCAEGTLGCLEGGSETCLVKDHCKDQSN